jgi:hypothetical protein
MTNFINFWSGKNYMKRDVSSGTASLNAPATPMSSNYITVYTITHNLGFIPFVRLYYQPFKDGAIYNAQGSRINSRVRKIDGTANYGPYCLGTVTSTTLRIELGYYTNALTGTYPVYWVIYKDYTL